MIRRQARQRRDYLYRRSATLRAAETATRRAALKASLASGKPLDPSIANDTQLRKDYAYDESQPTLSLPEALELDDEYAHLSGLTDPRILVTTSRSPSARLSTFAKEIRLVLPTAVRLNRGHLILPNLVSSANAAGLTDIVLLHEHRGVPSALTVSHLPHGPTASFSLHNVLLRQDLPAAAQGTVSESYPHLIFDGFSTALGKRVARILAHLFPPRDPVGPQTPANQLGSRVVTFRNEGDAIEVRHHVFVRDGYQSVQLAEVGPRMTMRLFEIRAGTVENKEGDVEWHLNQYTRTGRKKDYL
jgi:U3 small nucleolar ribonucleoprotein protein IMP4